MVNLVQSVFEKKLLEGKDENRIFFHDIICSFFVFPMSDRMHEIQQEFPEIELIHRSFALGWSANDF